LSVRITDLFFIWSRVQIFSRRPNVQNASVRKNPSRKLARLHNKQPTIAFRGLPLISLFFSKRCGPKQAQSKLLTMFLQKAQFFSLQPCTVLHNYVQLTWGLFSVTFLLLPLPRLMNRSVSMNVPRLFSFGLALIYSYLL